MSALLKPSTLPDHVSVITGYSTAASRNVTYLPPSRTTPEVRNWVVQDESTVEALKQARAENRALAQQLHDARRALAAWDLASNPDQEVLRMSDMTCEVVDAGFLARIRSWPTPAATNLYATVIDDDLGG